MNSQWMNYFHLTFHQTKQIKSYYGDCKAQLPEGLIISTVNSKISFGTQTIGSWLLNGAMRVPYTGSYSQIVSSWARQEWTGKDDTGGRRGAGGRRKIPRPTEWNILIIVSQSSHLTVIKFTRVSSNSRRCVNLFGSLLIAYVS